MSKTEVYGWRLRPSLKGALEHAAREEETSMAGLLDRIVEDWIGRNEGRGSDAEAEERRLRSSAMKVVGKVALAEGPYTAERVRERVRDRLEKRRATPRPR